MQDALEGRHVLTGSVNTETGESVWWTDRGWVEEENATPNHRLEFAFDDASSHETLMVQADPWTEGPWVTVRAPLPEDFDAVTEIRLDTPSLTARAPRSAIRTFHINDLTLE